MLRYLLLVQAQIERSGLRRGLQTQFALKYCAATAIEQHRFSAPPERGETTHELTVTIFCQRVYLKPFVISSGCFLVPVKLLQALTPTAQNAQIASAQLLTQGFGPGMVLVSVQEVAAVEACGLVMPPGKGLDVGGRLSRCFDGKQLPLQGPNVDPTVTWVDRELPTSAENCLLCAQQFAQAIERRGETAMRLITFGFVPESIHEPRRTHDRITECDQGLEQF